MDPKGVDAGDERDRAAMMKALARWPFEICWSPFPFFLISAGEETWLLYLLTLSLTFLSHVGVSSCLLLSFPFV